MFCDKCGHNLDGNTSNDWGIAKYLAMQDAGIGFVAEGVIRKWEFRDPLSSYAPEPITDETLINKWMQYGTTTGWRAFNSYRYGQTVGTVTTEEIEVRYRDMPGTEVVIAPAIVEDPQITKYLAMQDDGIKFNFLGNAATFSQEFYHNIENYTPEVITEKTVINKWIQYKGICGWCAYDLNNYGKTIGDYASDYHKHFRYKDMPDTAVKLNIRVDPRVTKYLAMQADGVVFEIEGVSGEWEFTDDIKCYTPAAITDESICNTWIEFSHDGDAWWPVNLGSCGRTVLESLGPIWFRYKGMKDTRVFIGKVSSRQQLIMDIKCMTTGNGTKDILLRIMKELSDGND